MDARLTSPIGRIIDLLTQPYFYVRTRLATSNTASLVLQSDDHFHVGEGHGLLIRSNRSREEVRLRLIGWIVNSRLNFLLGEQVDPTGKLFNSLVWMESLTASRRPLTCISSLLGQLCAGERWPPADSATRVWRDLVPERHQVGSLELGRQRPQTPL